MTVKVTKPAVNLREKLAELDKPSGVAGEAMLRADTPQEQFNLIGAGRKNLLINGAFRVSQRGDYTSGTSLNNGAYTLDRWTCTNGVGATIQHQTAMPTGEYGKSVKVLTSSGGTLQCAIEQRIEVADWMYGKTIVASAWVRSNSNKASINIYNNTDGFWTAQSHSGSGQWERLTITGTLPTSMSDFRVRIGLSQGGNTTIVAGDYFETAQVQLELGKVATPFEHRSYGEELALCQRYFNRIDGVNGKGLITTTNYSTTSAYGGYVYPVKMRTVPSISVSSGSHFRLWFNGSNVLCTGVGSDAGVDSCQLNFNVSSGLSSGNGSWVRFETAGWIAFDAEL